MRASIWRRRSFRPRGRCRSCFPDLTDANGFGWWTDETVAANIETLALLGQTVTPDLWDRSILEEVHGA